MLFIYDCHSWHFWLIADTVLHHCLVQPCFASCGSQTLGEKAPFASSVFGNYAVEKGLWVNKGTFSLPKLSFHPCLPAVVLLAVWEVGERRLSTHLWNQV